MKPFSLTVFRAVAFPLALPPPWNKAWYKAWVLLRPALDRIHLITAESPRCPQWLFFKARIWSVCLFGFALSHENGLGQGCLQQNASGKRNKNRGKHSSPREIEIETQDQVKELRCVDYEGQLVVTAAVQIQPAEISSCQSKNGLHSQLPNSSYQGREEGSSYSEECSFVLSFSKHLLNACLVPGTLRGKQRWEVALSPRSPVAKTGWKKERYPCAYNRSVIAHVIRHVLHARCHAINYALLCVTHYAFLFNVMLICKHSFKQILCFLFTDKNTDSQGS